MWVIEKKNQKEVLRIKQETMFQVKALLKFLLLTHFLTPHQRIKKDNDETRISKELITNKISRNI